MPSYRSGASRHQVRLPHHVIDLDADELQSAAGQHVDLRPRSFAVLRLLAENAGRLVSKDHIISAIWGDVVVTEDSLTGASLTFAKPLVTMIGVSCAPSPARAISWFRRNAMLS